jgi:hypothetical protein
MEALSPLDERVIDDQQNDLTICCYICLHPSRLTEGRRDTTSQFSG